MGFTVEVVIGVVRISFSEGVVMLKSRSLVYVLKGWVREVKKMVENRSMVWMREGVVVVPVEVYVLLCVTILY